ncbi:MAG: hypothetical protein HDQ87_06045 [Clostridia bacterium]|nr:hypothetical protein [Clostridia bacterium]
MRIRYYVILLALLAVFFFCACAPPADNTQMEIVGGADGPTAVWVAGELS